MFEQYAPVNLFAIGVTILAWIGFGAARVFIPQASSGKPSFRARRDNRSIIGIVLQGLAVGDVWYGPFTAGGGLTVDTILAGAAPALIALLSAALFIWSTQAMGANWGLVARTRADHRLVETGPLAFMRNPIYVALFGMLAATALALGHGIRLASAIPIFVAGTLIRVASEEAVLRATFGTAYDDYAKRVKRFIPHVI